MDSPVNTSMYSEAGYKDQREKIERETRDTWNVQSEKGDSVYLVTDKGADKCDCEQSNLHCYGCAACPRRFDCSCPDGWTAGITCKHIHASLLFSSLEEDDHLPLVPPSIQQIRTRDIDFVHDYSHRDDPVEVGLQQMDEMVDDEEWRERQRKEQSTSQAYAAAYKMLNEAKSRIEQAKRKNNCEQLENFVEQMKEAMEELDEVDRRGNVPRPNTARGHVTFIPAQIGKRGRPRNVEDTSSQPLPVLPPDELRICPVCLHHVAPRRVPEEGMGENLDEGNDH